LVRAAAGQDLDLLNRDLSKVVVIDDHKASVRRHPANVVKVCP
jgi:hypothetical protein